MPTIEENRRHWSAYDWAGAGDEWSEVWGGTSYLWWGSVYPRISSRLPAGSILEIAPGYGRFTQYLKDFCARLVIVDLAEPCIESCRRRFAGESHIEFFVNDGESLAMVPAASIDFAFSFDSLVHVEADVVRSYLRQLATILAPGGAAFLHHSNLLALRDPATGELPFENRHWRAQSVSAELVREICGEAGLRCHAQELVNWGLPELTDCFTLLGREGGDPPPPRVRENPGFMDEAARLAAIARHFAPPPAG